MSQGLKIINPNSELVISSDAMGLYCTGKGVLQGSIVQPTGTATGGGSGRVSGYSIYRVYAGNNVLFAIDLPLHMYVTILSITQPFAGAWDLKCHCGGALDSYGFSNVQYALSVWSFEPATGVLGNSGISIYNSAGNLSYDFSRSNPLFPRLYYLSIAGSYSSTIIPALTRPVVIGSPRSYSFTNNGNGVKSWYYRAAYSTWLRDFSNSLAETPVSTQRYVYGGIDPMDNSDDNFENTPCFIIEGNLLP